MTIIKDKTIKNYNEIQEYCEYQNCVFDNIIFEDDMLFCVSFVGVTFLDCKAPDKGSFKLVDSSFRDCKGIIIKDKAGEILNEFYVGNYAWAEGTQATIQFEGDDKYLLTNWLEGRE